MKDNGRKLKSMEYAVFDPGSGYYEGSPIAQCCISPIAALFYFPQREKGEGGEGGGQN